MKVTIERKALLPLSRVHNGLSGETRACTRAPMESGDMPVIWVRNWHHGIRIPPFIFGVPSRIAPIMSDIPIFVPDKQDAAIIAQ